MRRDVGARLAALAVEQPHVIGLRDNQLQRVLDGQYPLFRGDGGNQRLAHRGFSAARGTAEKNVQPRRNGRMKECRQVSRIVERQQLGEVAPFLAPLPTVPACPLVAIGCFRDTVDLVSRPPDGEAHGSVRDGWRLHDLEPEQHTRFNLYIG